MSYSLSYRWSPNCTGGRGGNKINAIVLHHAATTNFDQIGATFQNKSRATSAHFGVAPGKVCQYVDINNTAWHCGNWKGNQQTIGIEHVNASGAPNWEISDETIKTGAELLANLAKQLGWSHLSIGGNVKFHSDFKSTYCPGKIRDAGLGAREVQLANEILGTGNIPQPSVQPQPKQQSNGGGYLSFDYRGNVREQPTTKSGVFATYGKGAWVKFDGYVHGEVVNGSDKWLRSSRSKKYVHESVTGGVYGLPDLGTVNLPSQPSNAPQTGSNGLIPQNGTYRATVNMKIRRSPSLSGQVAGTFTKGAEQRYDSYIDANGYRWVSWIGASGNRNYVARRNFATGEIYGECY